MSGRSFARVAAVGLVLILVNSRSNSQAAEQSSRTEPSRIGSTSSSPDPAVEDRLAREWGLTAEDWSRYRQLMRGPLGVYSPNLDPLTALGIEARSEEERRRYAELQVRVEARRVDKLLAYQRAYDAAWTRLYPHLLPVAGPAAEASSSPIGSSEPGRLAVFVKDGCSPCDERVRELQAAGRPFDVYVVGSRNDDEHIRAWAMRVGIDPARVRSRTITLNHDAGRWLSIGGQGELPALLHEVNGQWVRE